MSENSCFRGPFKGQHGKRVETMLRSERQHLYHICWSLWRQLSWKKSLLVICKFLRLFLNTLTADDKYSLGNRDILREPIQILLSKKQKGFSQFFFFFFFIVLKFRLNFEHFPKKTTHIAGNFPNHWLQNTWLDKCLKSPFSEDHSKGNLVTGSTHFCNLHDSNSTIFIDHWQENWVAKGPS